MADLSVALAKVRGNSHFLRKNTSRSTRLCYARIAADTTGTLQNGGKVCHASSICTFSLVVCFATPKLDQNIDEPMRYPKLILIWKKQNIRKFPAYGPRLLPQCLMRSLCLLEIGEHRNY
ncbi:hypothetical protein IG631_18557 [Alternaria alternata]|nr:hypothetical protein IG631_18557 [Alternaria alternata]